MMIEKKYKRLKANVKQPHSSFVLMSSELKQNIGLLCVVRISKPFYHWTFVQWTSVLLHSTKRKNIIYYSFTPTCQRKIPAGSNNL